jgi:hypothetical protein
MPIYSRICGAGHKQYDLFEPMTYPDPPCPEPGCGVPTRRRILSGQPNTIVADSIPGGIWIRNGLCNPDGTPRRYDSLSEIRREAKKRGLVNGAEHTTNPRDGSDKAPHTQRFVAVDLAAHDPANKEQRRRDTAAWLGVSMEEYDRITNPPPADMLPMSETEFVIRQEVSQFMLSGHGLDD